MLEALHNNADLLSSGCSAARIPRMCGTTTRECRMRSCRVRGVSRETSSCQHCMPWASTKLCHKFMPPSVKVRCSSRIWTTSTSSVTLLALQRFSCRSSCRSSGQLASKLTLGRPKFGTVQASSRRIWTRWALRRGQVRDQRRIEGLWCWAATEHLCRSGWQTKGSHMRSFSVESQLSKTRRAHGCSS